jgi:imidazolonepropionase-like amidohydrolase
MLAYMRSTLPFLTILFGSGLLPPFTGTTGAWVATGGTVLFGTDLGAVDYDPSEEYALMAEAGMSFRQILASLTTAPAERFGESKELGQIAQGFQADLVILKDDSSKNI